MPEAFSATVTISTNESGDTSVSLVASDPVVANVNTVFTSEDGQSETSVEIVPPGVTETHFIEPDDELVIEFVSDEGDDDADEDDFDDEDLDEAA